MVRACVIALGLQLMVAVVVIGQTPPPSEIRMATVEVASGSAPVVKEVRIGFPEALFKDVPRVLIDAAATPFRKMIQKELGLHGTLNIVSDYAILAEEMRKGKLDIAVFHGFEYAWVQDLPGLHPIVITNPSCGKVQACLVVRSDSKVKSPAQLKGACVAVPKGSKAHCQMFLERLCEKEKVGPGDCCPAKLAKGTTLTPEEAILSVVSGDFEAALVDISAILALQDDKPGLSEQVKILAKSELLPSAVVVCRKGAMTDHQIKKVADGLLNCHKTAIGRTFTMFWQLEGFKEVSPDYRELLQKCVKCYPPPAVLPQAPMPSGLKD